MQSESPFHEGELLVQQRLSEAKEAQQNGRIIDDKIPQGALKFIEQQPLVVLGSVDRHQNIWASILFGHPGFVKAVEQHAVEVDLSQALCNWNDPFWSNIEHYSQVGALFIELASRRRLRLNGTSSRTSSERLRLDVVESYPNCPKYIQRRHINVRIDSTSSQLLEQREGQFLEVEQQELITSADTFFVASAHPSRGVDASHRGGNPGFVQILSETKIRVPDYVGNSMYNTLGNFVVNPRAGLAFLDFEREPTSQRSRYRILQLTGRPEILWDLDDQNHTTGGTNRYWNFTIDRWLETALPQSLQSEFLDYSPFNPLPEFV